MQASTVGMASTATPGLHDAGAVLTRVLCNEACDVCGRVRVSRIIQTPVPRTGICWHAH